MTETKQNFTIQDQLCLGCGSEYEAKHITLFGTQHDLSQGYCYFCRAKRIAEDKAKEDAQLKAKIAEKRRHWRAECGIPLKFMNEEFGTFDSNRPGNVKTVYGKCLAYAKGFPLLYQGHLRKYGKAYSSLLLFSDIAGVGKSHLVASICHHILNTWNGEEITRPVLFITESELLGKIQETFNFTSEEKRYRESEQDIINQLIYKPLIVLDEVGYERRTDLRFVRRVLFRVINGRYDNLRPIIITTNLNPEKLRSYLDAVDDKNIDEAERTYDRLWEMTGGKFIKLTGESYRRK